MQPSRAASSSYVRGADRRDRARTTATALRRASGREAALGPALIERYRVLADIVVPAVLSGPVSKDPDDDLVLATALAASAELIVSRDKHLRNIKHFQRIPILNRHRGRQSHSRQ